MAGLRRKIRQKPTNEDSNSIKHVAYRITKLQSTDHLCYCCTAVQPAGTELEITASRSHRPYTVPVSVFSEMTTVRQPRGWSKHFRDWDLGDLLLFALRWGWQPCCQNVECGRWCHCLFLLVAFQLVPLPAKYSMATWAWQYFYGRGLLVSKE